MAPLNRFVRFSLAVALSVTAAAGASPRVAQTANPSSASLFTGLSWHCIGPFGGGPVASVAGVAGEAGVYVITTPSGGAWKTIDGGDTWAAIDRAGPAPASSQQRSWTDPANPRRIARVDALGIEVSLDGGATWTASHHLAIADVTRLTPRTLQPEPASRPRSINGAPVNVSIADSTRPGLIFAGTSDAVYVSFDDGARWQSLRLNMPGVTINDLDIRGNDLVAATRGRSIWQLDDVSPLRQMSWATTGTPVVLFKPAAAVLPKPGVNSEEPGDGVNLDYYLGAQPGGVVTLEVVDAAGRVVHTASSAAPDAADRWLPVTPPISAAPGHHRVVWRLRFDPPAAQKHRYAHLARALFEQMPADPDGPRVLAGTYRVRLLVSNRAYEQTLIVRSDPGESAADLAVDRRRFDFALKMYDATQQAHQAFAQLTRVRAQLRPMLTSTDPQLAQLAADLDAQLAGLDGSDWTGLVIPDADDEAGEVDEKEGKHPDFVPPKPLSVSKDYDDPTSILGRMFANVDHAPAFATMSASLGDMLTKAARSPDPPGAVATADYDRTCQQLAGVLDAWRAMNAQDLPSFNAEMARRRLATLPIAANVPTLVCAAKAS